MSGTKVAPLRPEAGAEYTERSIRDRLSQRQSQELVLAFSGALGAGIEDVRPLFEEALKPMDYTVVDIKVSRIIKENTSRLLKLRNRTSTYDDLDVARGLERYRRLQDAGNDLRGTYSNDILAQLIVHQIATHATRSKAEEIDLDKPPFRVAFIVDQLKHYDEVKFLRDVYGNNFYLVGVLSGYARRLDRLVRETRADVSDVSHLMDRDREEDITHGQQLDRTLKLSDVFIRNSSGNRVAMETQVRRFVKLIHGAVDITPTKDEFGMYVAYSSGLASACMSRQVGAAILSAEGSVLSTGCNDVPKAGGGLYSDTTKPDFRCVMKTEGICHNDAEKDEIRDEILEILKSSGIPVTVATEIAKKIRVKSRLRDLIEFSRAVHAEMDALISVARRGGGTVSGASLYTTTYPCHNCARHILASGITKVFFIEPYEKSLAIKLHSDSIVHDTEPDDRSPNKVPFLHFEGVAPRRYQDLFLFASGRKRDGKRLAVDLAQATKKVPQMLDGYRIIEKKVLEALKDQRVIGDN